MRRSPTTSGRERSKTSRRASAFSTISGPIPAGSPIVIARSGRVVSLMRIASGSRSCAIDHVAGTPHAQGDARHLVRTAGTRTFQENHIASRCAGFLPEQPARGRRFSQDVAIIFATSVARPPTPRYPPEHERTRRLHHDYRGRRPPAVARTHAGAPYGLPRPPGPTHRRCRLYLCNDRRDLSGRSGQVVIAAWKEYQDA